MARQSITFDFLTTGADRTAGGFRKIGDNTVLAARGARVLADTIEKLGRKEDRTAAESAALARALRQTGDAEDRAAAKAVLADAAIRRLDDAMQDTARNSGKARGEVGGLAKALDGLQKHGGPALLGPALLLAPAITSLAGAAAGAAVGLGGAFAAGAIALAGFGAVAKPVLSDAKKAAGAVAKAQDTYNAAIGSGVPKAKAYKAEQLAIAKAYAGMSPAQIQLSRQLGAMASAWDNVKAAETPVVAGAIQPWLKSVTSLMGQLKPIIDTLAPVIHDLGVKFNALVNSQVAARFRDFVATFGAWSVSAAGSTLIDFFKAFMIILPQFSPLIGKAAEGIAGLGPAVLKWAGSKATADHITAFMAWFKTNGPLVGRLIKNVGGALAALAPGLTAGAATELNIISGFLGFIARLPPAIAKPLAEVAGALLLMNKLGVLKVGLKIVGPAVKWLTGGLINLGGGAAAGTEIRAAMVSGGTAAAAEIRAAMAGGGAVAGGETGAAAAGAKAGTGFAGGFAAALAGPAAAGLIGAALIRAVGDKLSPAGTFAGNLSKQFQADGHLWSTSLLHSFTFGGLEGWLTAKIGIPVGAALDKIGSFIKNQWATIWSNTVAGAAENWKRLVSVFDTARHQIAHIWDVLMTDITVTFDIAKENIRITWDKIKILFLRGADVIVTIMGRLPGPLGAPFRAAHKSIQGELAGIQRDVANATGNIQRDWDRLHGKTLTLQMIASGQGGVKVASPGLAAKEIMLSRLAAGGLVRMGTGPAADDVPAMLSRGEVVVPAGMVQAGAVDHLRGRLPGFASGGFARLGGQSAALQGAVSGAVAADTQTWLTADLRSVLKSMKGQIAAAAAASGGGPSGRGVPGTAAQVVAWIKAALALAGKPQSWLGGMELMVRAESGGNPLAANRTAAGAAAGYPEGIAQTIPATFRAYALPGHGNIWNPVDDLIASARYIGANYGSPYNIPGLGTSSYRGYKLGGLAGMAAGGLVPGYAGGGGVTTTGPTGGPAATAAYRARINALERREGADYLGLRRAFLRGPRRYLNRPVYQELLKMHKLQGAEQVAYGHLKGAGLTKVNLDRLGAAARAEQKAALSSVLNRAHGGHPGWASGLRYWLGQLSGVTRKGLPGGQLTSGPGGAGLPAITHTYGGDVTDTIGAFLSSVAAPFTGKLMDRGGWLKPGWSSVYNATGRPEHLVPARSDGTVRLEIASGGGSDFEQFMAAMIKKYVKVRGGGSVQRAFGAH